MSPALQARGPRTVGKDQIVAKLANGSKSAVYKGIDPATGEAVAIKVASSALARDQVLLQSFFLQPLT